MCARACSIRKQEDLVLDFWSSENAFKVSACLELILLPVCVLCSQQDLASLRPGGRRSCSGVPGFHSGDSSALVVRHCGCKQIKQGQQSAPVLQVFVRSVLCFPRLYTGAQVQVARL